MVDNFASVFQSLQANLARYEDQKAGAEDMHQRMLNDLKAPYHDMKNADEFLAALRGLLTEAEIEFWYRFPDYSYGGKALSPVDLGETGHTAIMLDKLERLFFLIPVTDRTGHAGYQRTYLFFLVYYYLMTDQADLPQGTKPLWEACLHWWTGLVDGGESAMLRNPLREYRVIPHQGTLTGEAKFGKIPMNLEIPDTRQVLPMDKLEEVLRGCHSIAVIDCICRKAKDLDGTRECDHPIKDVCFLFNEAADPEIAAGTARPVTVEEAIAIVRDCHDRGLMQEISNAEHPLAMCNCCKCCCLPVVSQRRYEDVLLDSARFMACSSRPDACVGCGACVSACPMDAVSLGESSGTLAGTGTAGTAGTTAETPAGPQISSACFGCGLCVAACPAGVLKMSPRPGAADKLPHAGFDRIYL